MEMLSYMLSYYLPTPGNLIWAGWLANSIWKFSKFSEWPKYLSRERRKTARFLGDSLLVVDMLVLYLAGLMCIFGCVAVSEEEYFERNNITTEPLPAKQILIQNNPIMATQNWPFFSHLALFANFAVFFHWVLYCSGTCLACNLLSLLIFIAQNF